MERTIFEKIIDREIPADIVFEDDQCIAINDISPQAPTHILIIPKKRIPRISESENSDADIIGHLIIIARDIAKSKNLNGFRLVINNGRQAGETVPHLHIHLLSGRPMAWPPG